MALIRPFGVQHIINCLDAVEISYNGPTHIGTLDDRVLNTLPQVLDC
jgi:hypothetical protein